MGAGTARKPSGRRSRKADPPAWDAPRFQSLLLDWYGRNRRTLPWRSEPSPYRVWVSEIMLQQTQVRTVLPYFERFVARFPDVPALAAASEREVLECWAGLGYYRRARHLHQAARMIVDEMGGRFPETMEGIRRLPGVGRYVAGAVLSIAFNQDQPIVDGNIRRVVSRLHGARSEPPEGFFWRQAESWLPAGRSGDFNQAVMELGALVCVAPNPRCASCPVAPLCTARRLGIQGRIPAPRSTSPPEEVKLVLLAIEHRGSLLLSQRACHPCIPGSWGLPGCGVPAEGDPISHARRLLRQVMGKSSPLEECPAVRHGITRYRIIAKVFRAGGKIPSAPAPHMRWFPAREAERLLTSSLYRKALRAAGIDTAV